MDYADDIPRTPDRVTNKLIQEYVKVVPSYLRITANSEYIYE